MSPLRHLARSFLLALNLFLTPVLSAGVKFTNSDYSAITAGQTFEITWAGDGSEATLALLTGDPSDLKPVITIGSSPSSPFPWLVPTDLTPASSYVLSIAQSGVTNYSPGFAIGGTSSPTSTAPTDTDSTATDEATTTPAPLYLAHGLLGGTNTSNPSPDSSGIGAVVLPTGESKVGQYAAFDGGVARARVELGVWGVGLMAVVGVVLGV
ncbi:MAG: hypothetical protein HETSPECPRED_001168 [Heterodermia speciosa]|uniref:Yeast cell wall synthesis Kre9/Knh1-like N-terminal domain-containing protein n=1 Tax=Heterodermia speciosa TaxID=116794 RepID=A0A8H3J0Z7_9LECA|nr:MAG: hypothetical protein HETSPECPRED_001168 [Heterodermia speciosa]